MESFQKPEQKSQGYNRKPVIENDQIKYPARLLLACLRFKQDRSALEIQEQATLTDWEMMFEEAVFHGVVQILYKRCNDGNLSVMLPKDIQTKLRGFYLSNVRDGLRLSKQAEKILAVFFQTGIPVIPLKGLYLAEKVYQNIALRPMGDIDLMVPREKVMSALEQLSLLGYRPTYPVDLPNDLNYIHSLPLWIDSSQHSIDLHWLLYPSDIAAQVDSASIWNNSRPDSIFGTRMLAMRHEELLLHLCLHFIYMHRHLGRLQHVVDLAMVLNVFQDQIDWNRLLLLAAEWKLKKAAFLTLTLTDHLLYAPVPPEVLQTLQPVDFEPLYLENLLEELFNHMDFSINLAEFWKPIPLRQRIKFFRDKVFCPPYILRQSYPRLANGIGLPFTYILRLFDVFKRQVPTALKLILHDPESQISARQVQNIEEIHRWLDT